MLSRYRSGAAGDDVGTWDSTVGKVSYSLMRTSRLLLVLLIGLGACSSADAEVDPTVSALETLPPVITTEPLATPTVTTTSLAETDPDLAEGEATTTTTTTTLPPTTGLELQVIETIVGDISPKSVVATGDGLFFAQNMMYRHTVTVYDEDYELVTTIPDTVEVDGVELAGAPVEAVPTSDGSHVYVSNYRMYGPGYSRPGSDECNLSDWDESFVYRIDTITLQIDQVIPVGAVPKFLAITPDDATVLASNWCSFDMSIIDTESATETARVDLGRHPRGIAVSADGRTAYVAVMGSTNIAVVDLDTLDVEWIRGVGANPRHVVLDPSGRFLYATLNGEGRVIRLDLATGEVIDRVRTGSAPRSMAISDDGLSLYVVNYNSDTLAKIDTATMEVIQTLDVPLRPIGVTFDSSGREVWVASYSGAITVLQETDVTE